ncbi:MAG TPA: DUF3237 family protein [Fibrobacteria bacterium]|nr:DUF3237 family protein [Fibrobacteria bacterium]
MPILVGWTFAQAQVDVSGTVKSGRDASAVAGAQVGLASHTASTTTDAEGRFLLSASGVVRSTLPSSGASLDPDGRSILLNQPRPGPMDIQVVDPAGTQKAVVYSGILPAGNWRVPLPALGQGVFLCRFQGEGATRTIRFLGSSGTSVAGRIGGWGGAIASARSAAAAVDTLVVTKSGYRTGKLALESLQQSGLSVVLEDTTSAGSEDATIVPDPSWPCFMAAGIPPPSLGKPVFTITLQIDAIRKVGLTKFGERIQYDIKGGSVTGDKITASVVSGGLDYDLTLSNGSVEVEQIVILKAGSTPILMRNAGVAPIGTRNARVVLDFEAPNSSSYTWLHTGKFAATRVVDTVAKTIKMEVFDISGVTNPAKQVQIKDPAGVVNQTWDCVSFTGQKGATVFTENVALGSSISIGASKRGSRNIIPITGGTTTGKIAGKILNGGADYQLGGLDARYTLAPNDGEYIIIRNCGANGLVPVFEARVAGPYNYLNENKYLSSSPSVSGSSVSLTFYEKN